MMMKVFTISASIFIIKFVDISLQFKCKLNRTEPFQTDKGPVRGLIYKTINKHIPYAGFKGIPYAKPPVDDLRFQCRRNDFQPPEEPEPWKELNLTSDSKSACPQLITRREIFSGSEDCLYMNINTPKVFLNDTKKRAVMVWIFGSAFSEGVINSSFYGPDYLIEEDIVSVAISYRHGALGFLTLDIPEATGNAGMKDQVLALKWVNKNIENFGGDPNLVTIFGQSAGAVSVQLLKLSPLSRGLFSRSIAMSGSPLNHWAVVPKDKAVSRAKKLAADVGITATDPSDIFYELLDVSAEKIIRASHAFVIFAGAFKPTTEDPENTDSPFLTECAIPMYEAGNFSDEPHMLGFVKYESIVFSGSAAKFMKWFAGALDSVFGITGVESIADIIRLRGLLNSTMDGVTDIGYDIIELGAKLTTDIYFIGGIDRTQQYLSKGKGPVYYYRNSFDYDGALHKVHGNQINGTAHGDDIPHIFYIYEKNDTSDDITLQRRRMVKMWTNMAKYGSPTPGDTVDPLLNVIWPDSRPNGTCLEINNDYTIGERPIDELISTLRTLPSAPVRFLGGTCF